LKVNTAKAKVLRSNYEMKRTGDLTMYD